mgnify:FL=1
MILYDGHLALYKHSLDVILYFIAGPTENELTISVALNSLYDSLIMLLRNQVEKRGILENLDLVLLCLDETIDDGCVICSSPYSRPSNARIPFSGSLSIPMLQRLRRESLDHALKTTSSA